MLDDAILVIGLLVSAIDARGPQNKRQAEALRRGRAFLASVPKVEEVCMHGVPHVHLTAYCPTCLRTAMRPEDS